MDYIGISKNYMPSPVSAIFSFKFQTRTGNMLPIPRLFKKTDQTKKGGQKNMPIYNSDSLVT